jgi:peptidoglycan/LPS O-acetylase OafA/YrhL
LINAKRAWLFVACILIAIVSIGQIHQGFDPILDFYSQVKVLAFVGGMIIFHLFKMMTDEKAKAIKAMAIISAAISSIIIVLAGMFPFFLAQKIGLLGEVIEFFIPIFFVGSWIFMSKAGMDFSPKPLLALGDVSYSLYLVHMPVIIMLQQVWLPLGIEQGAFITVATTTMVSLVLAFYARKYIEVPALNCFKRRKPAPAPKPFKPQHFIS